MKTVMKIVLAGVILLVLSVGGCVALVGGVASEVDKEMKKEQAEHALTTQEFKSVEMGMSFKDFIKKYGKPDPDSTQESVVGDMKMKMVYYNIEDQGPMDMYQFAFTNGVLESKARY